MTFLQSTSPKRRETGKKESRKRRKRGSRRIGDKKSLGETSNLDMVVDKAHKVEDKVKVWESLGRVSISHSKASIDKLLKMNLTKSLIFSQISNISSKTWITTFHWISMSQMSSCKFSSSWRRTILSKSKGCRRQRLSWKIWDSSRNRRSLISREKSLSLRLVTTLQEKESSRARLREIVFFNSKKREMIILLMNTL